MLSNAFFSNSMSKTKIKNIKKGRQAIQHIVINSVNQNRTGNTEKPDQNQQKLQKVTVQDPGLGLLQ